MNVLENLIIIYRAPSMMERDAILNQLHENGIEALSTERDVSRKVTNSTIDLAFEGYSATMGGFPITVMKNDEEAAKKIIQDFIRKINVGPASPPSYSHLRKFYISSIYSTMLPLAFHALGIYHLFKGLRAGEKVRTLHFIGAMLLYAASAVVGLSILQSWLGF